MRFRRWPVPVEPIVHGAERGLRLGEVGTEGERLLDRLSRWRRYLRRRRIAVDRACRIDVRQTGPRERKAWIELGRPLVGCDCEPIRVRPQLVPQVPAAKVEVVGLGISRVPGRQGGQPVRREAQSNLPGDGRAQLALELEHATRLAVKRLGPYLLLVAHANQLRRHPQLDALGDRPFNQILDVELLADLRDRLSTRSCSAWSMSAFSR